VARGKTCDLNPLSLMPVTRSNNKQPQAAMPTTKLRTPARNMDVITVSESDDEPTPSSTRAGRQFKKTSANNQRAKARTKPPPTKIMGEIVEISSEDDSPNFLQLQAQIKKLQSVSLLYPLSSCFTEFLQENMQLRKECSQFKSITSKVCSVIASLCFTG